MYAPCEGDHEQAVDRRGGAGAPHREEKIDRKSYVNKNIKSFIIITLYH